MLRPKDFNAIISESLERRLYDSTIANMRLIGRIAGRKLIDM